MKKLLARLFTGKRDRTTKQKESHADQAFSGVLSKDEQLVRDVFANCGDVIYRNLSIPALENRKTLIVMVGHLANGEIVNRDIIARLAAPVPGGEKTAETLLDFKHKILHTYRQRSKRTGF
ncbi:MAG: hypothetical protein Q7J85_03635 [Bacillota bacterium]|nr:hypothetical protein [Bacillota bacterium]